MNLRPRITWSLGLLLALAGAALGQEPYDDFSWVKSFAAVDDSYTAGIGSGELLDASCRRYATSYAVMLASQFVGLENFYNLGCSGARTPDVLEQIESLPGGLDLAVMTAGGNDLCLAQNGLDNYLEGNLQALIEALDAKMNPDGIIVVMSYAQFFDATTDACTREEWSLLPPTSLPLSPTLRASLNDLVTQTNSVIFSAVTVSYVVYGTVWAGWDHGQTSVLPNFTYCNDNEAPYWWGFTHVDASSAGHEWEAFLQTPHYELSWCMEGNFAYHGGKVPSTSFQWVQEVPSFETVCLGTGVGSLSCRDSCCGFITCGAWCNAYCGGACAH